MNKILILGDPHLGKGQNLSKQFAGSTLNSRVADQLKLLDWVYDTATACNVRHIVVTGDVFDEPKPHYTLVMLFIDWLRKCSDNSINVHIIAGNHDILRSGQTTTSPLDIVSSAEIAGITVYKSINTLHLSDCAITMLPFRDRRSFNTDSNKVALDLLKNKLPYHLTSINKYNKKILIGHFALEGSIPVGTELDELSNELFCPLDMFKGYDYVWMGHVHKFQIMQKSPHIAHIGSMDISDFGEVDQTKYVAILSVDEAKVDLNYIELPTRKLNNIVIKLPEIACNATKFVEQEIAKIPNLDKSIIKLTIILPSNSQYSIDRTLIEDHLYKNGVFFVSKISEERTFVSLKKQINNNIDNAINEVSAIKTYSTLIDENIREEFIELACGIVNELKENNK